MEDNVFEQLAKKYDTVERVKMAKVIANEVKKELTHSKSKTLMDYGCGTGLVGLELTDLVESVLFVDSSKQMLGITKNKILEKDITNALISYFDFTKEIPDHKVDIVLLSLVLLHIPDTKQILQQLFHHILKPNGKLIIVDFDKNELIDHPKVHNGFSQGELKQLLAEIGFVATEIKTFYHGHRIFMNQDASMFISSSIKGK